MKPRLIHPQTIIVSPFDEANTTLDGVIDDLELPENIDLEITEPDIKTKYKTPITIKAQVSYNDYNKLTGSPTGFELKGAGYILINKSDKSLLKINDRIDYIDGDAVEFYIIEGEPRAHYNSKNQYKMYFDYETQGLINNAQI